MDETQAKALRARFPKSAIGIKPQPYKKDSPKSKCNVCNGFHGQPAAHLEYVGHAATTSRLLEVDPEWSWEPMAYDMGGLPLFDSNRNLWIKLTICGVTRIGVGDGLGLKECIGDAIRNAAMRFGVALDLWAKEDLPMVDEQRSEPEPPPATRTMSRTTGRQAKAPADDGWIPPQTDDAAAPTLHSEGVTPPLAAAASPDVIDPKGKQMKAIHAGMNEAGLSERVAGLEFLSEVTGREVTTSKDLTRAEAGKVLDELAQINQHSLTDATPALTKVPSNAELLAEIGALADKTEGGRKQVAADWAETHEGESLRDATDLGGLELLRDDLKASAS